MRILAVDIGAGTQDILLFDSSLEIGNQVKMIMPSPTTVVGRKIARATREGKALLLTGGIMGGGPNASALKRHVRAGLTAYATPEAALTFDDHLAEVERMGVTIVSADEARRLQDAEVIVLRDLDMAAIRQALVSFNVSPDFDALAIAVLDHGHSPPDVSDRVFRFQHLERLVREKREITAWTYLVPELPPYLTRMRAVAGSVEGDVPIVFVDTAVAAALGVVQDPEVARHPRRMVVNVGNAHTVAFYLEGTSILGLLEHHSVLLDAPKADSLLGRLVAGAITREEVYQDGGHGAVVLEKGGEVPFLGVTGPRREMMAASGLRPHFAVPHGDMMLVGCFGLIRACAERMEVWREEILRILATG